MAGAVRSPVLQENNLLLPPAATPTKAGVIYRHIQRQHHLTNGIQNNGNPEKLCPLISEYPEKKKKLTYTPGTSGEIPMLCTRSWHYSRMPRTYGP